MTDFTIRGYDMIKHLTLASMLLLSSTVGAYDYNNRLYMKVSRVELESFTRGGNDFTGSIRGKNIIKKLCPECPKFWNKRTVYVTAETMVYYCHYNAGCEPETNSWYKAITPTTNLQIDVAKEKDGQDTYYPALILYILAD